jgi:arsenical pump membrane protein
MQNYVSWLLAGLGLVGLIAAFTVSPTDAPSAAAQNWSPFVLVTGLLLIGLVAADDGLFAAAGHQLARLSSSGTVLFVGATAMIAVVTAVLNLDTSVAFLTPVLVYAAKSRGEGEAPILYGCLLLSNAGSLFLPGSNLTNLIVLGHVRLTGAAFLARMWAPALAALLVTAGVVAVLERRSLRVNTKELTQSDRPTLGLGLLAVTAATLLVLVLRSPALPVLAVGVVAIGIRLAAGRDQLRHVVRGLGVPILFGLLVNNLPAASLLAARTPDHPFALLIGLNLGPNLFVTGSLAWMLWLRAARSAGAQPSIAQASRIGVLAVPLSMAAALGVLVATGVK